jgi:hypothetical protein
MLSDLERDHKIRKTLFKDTIEESSPKMHRTTRERFQAYWHNRLDKLGLDFTDACYTMSLTRFRQQLGLPPVETPGSGGAVGSVEILDNGAARGVEKILGSYQIFRPHSYDKDRYILEALAIQSKNDGGTENVMYSHTTPQAGYMYRGDVHVASRYYHSLLIRRHESDEAKNAFRSIMFYVGTGAQPGCLSGLMLRGVSGRGDFGNQAAGFPFLALRTKGNHDFRKPDLLESASMIYRLHNTGHIIVGDIYEEGSTEIFGYCKALFDSIRQLQRGVFLGTDLVIHTIPHATIRQHVAISLSKWENLVEKCFSEVVETESRQAPSDHQSLLRD